jgi:amino acid efflux transporter
VAAIVLTVGTTNAYINGAIIMTGELLRTRTRTGTGTGTRGSGSGSDGNNDGSSSDSDKVAPKRLLLPAIAVTGAVLLAAYGLRLVSTVVLVTVPTTLFLAVYLGAMTAALRLLRGAARLAALPGALAVLIMLTFCGWALTIPAAVTLVAARSRRPETRRPANSLPATPASAPSEARPAQRELVTPR